MFYLLMYLLIDRNWGFTLPVQMHIHFATWGTVNKLEKLTAHWGSLMAKLCVKVSYVNSAFPMVEQSVFWTHFSAGSHWVWRKNACMPSDEKGGGGSVRGTLPCTRELVAWKASILRVHFECWQAWDHLCKGDSTETLGSNTVTKLKRGIYI